MLRDLGRLTATAHDLLVIGGGITGLIAAYDAAQRGLSVALIDRGDFGAATSFNHFKTVHGGLRYLQEGDFIRMRRSILERRAFALIAPHLVSPLAFLAPTSRTPTRSPLAFQMAFLVDGWLGHDRNAGVRADLHLPPGRVMSLAECQRVAPLWDPDGATGGALWYDYQMPLAERLTMGFALAAHAHGASLANHVEALAPIRVGNTICGVNARDILGRAETFEIRARVTLNAAGPWVRSVMASCGSERDMPLLKAVNIVTSRPANGPALVRANPRGRALVLAPWRGHAFIGTGELDARRGPDDRGVSEDELQTFLGDINATFPSLNLRQDEVSLVHRGLVPAVVHNGEVRVRGQAEVIDHGGEGIAGLVTAVGVKYTTARLLAERAVDVVVRKLERTVAPCRTGAVPLPGATTEGAEPLIAALRQKHGGWLDEPAARHLAAAYGTGCHQIADLAGQDTALRDRVTPGSPVLGAEIVHAARREMALTLTDVVVRRTALGVSGPPATSVARRCADILASELHWSAERVSAEIQTLRSFYDPIVMAR